MPNNQRHHSPEPAAPLSLNAAYFERLYEGSTDGDPWNFTQSAYEAAKYADTLARLPRPRYGSGLEVGCSIGVLTRQLATRCEHLLAVDINSTALDQARGRCEDQSWVKFALGNLIESVPPGPFDLIILSEVAYYWTPVDFSRIWRSLVDNLSRDGQIILVHWRDEVPDYPQTGDQVHSHARELASQAGMIHRGEWVETSYRIDLWERSNREEISDADLPDERMSARS